LGSEKEGALKEEGVTPAQEVFEFLMYSKYQKARDRYQWNIGKRKREAQP